MLQSSLAAKATRSCRFLSSAYSQPRIRRFATEPTGRPADPQVYSKNEHEVQPAVPTGKPEEMKEKYEPETAKRQIEAEGTEYKSSSDIEPLTQPKWPHISNSRLESTAVHNPAESVIQQKRKNSTSTLEEVSCAGLDGTPWPKDGRSAGERVEDDKDYYRHHKASPLSEIQVADTRKPITRATDGTASEYTRNEDVVGWMPEQLDTAEEALERARRIWRENAMRGDPDTPHGRVLRVLRGE